MKIHEETFLSFNGSTAAPGQLFFDIECTGLSPKTASVYLIGCSWYEDGIWHLRLYFANDANDELEILSAFSEFTTGFDTVIHFNGDRFDIPFVKYRLAKYGIDDPFCGMESIDLFKLARPYKKLLGAENLKQKTLEVCMGLERTDTFNGGELIKVYDEYLRTEDAELEHFLLLHNLEDVKGMSTLTAIFEIPKWLKGNFELLESRPYDSCGQAYCRMHFVSNYRFPAHTKLNCAIKNPDASGSCSAKSGIISDISNAVSVTPAFFEASEYDLYLTLPAYDGRVRHYYKDTAAYYYIPGEGMAVHKSISAFLEPSKRKRATIDNCFGLCLPEELTDISNSTDFVHSWIRKFTK